MLRVSVLNFFMLARVPASSLPVRERGIERERERGREREKGRVREREM